MLGIVTGPQTEIKTIKRERPEHFRHLNDSDSVNDTELGSNDSLGEDKEGEVRHWYDAECEQVTHQKL